MLKELWRDFVDGLIDNDEKVASKKKFPKLFNTKMLNLFMTKMAKLGTLFMTKSAENPYPLGPHIPI